jgi:hypothetical protein
LEKTMMLCVLSFSCYNLKMTITQTVEIPASHRLIIDVPMEVPTGPVIITFTPAETKCTATPNRKPISWHFGKLAPGTFGDPVAYQRAIRDEWD